MLKQETKSVKVLESPGFSHRENANDVSCIHDRIRSARKKRQNLVAAGGRRLSAV